MLRDFIKQNKWYFFAVFLLIIFFILSFKGETNMDYISEYNITESIDITDNNVGNTEKEDKGIIKNITNIIKENIIKSNNKPAKITTVMAWVYPGEPSCNSSSEYKDGRRVDVLKVEYFRINYSGELEIITEDIYGCNAFSESNVLDIKEYSKEQYVTVSSPSSYEMKIFLDYDSKDLSYTNQLVNFVVENDLTGIEIDFEDFGGWSADIYNSYKDFIKRLGNELHKNNKKLMIDGPAISNETEQSWFAWRYEDFNDLPVDYVVVMAYDYQFDHGAGNPVTPLVWLDEVIKWTKNKYTKIDKIVVGVPSYGYKGVTGSTRVDILTYNQITTMPGFNTATRDESGELMWQISGNSYVFQDSESIDRKIEVIRSNGIGKISIWHLGDNKWPNI